ncbi:MAG: cardiolipin synthase [Prevotella sp.]|nr:cardiolipin synthase [Prevotella sp.]
MNIQSVRLSRYWSSLLLLILFLPSAVRAQSDSSAGNLRSDSLIRRQMEQLGVNFSHNNSVTLLMSGQQKFDDMFCAIRQARHSIHLEYFNFRNDSIASLLFDLLREKRRQGVEVRALFDGFGNDSNNRPLLKRHIRALRQDSIDIWEFDPIRFPWVNHIWPRDHRKIVVIDGSIAYTGGMNVADYYIKGTEQVGSWRDMHCRLEGGVVNELQLIFAHIWKKTTGEDIWKPEYFRAYHPQHFEGLKADTTSTAGRKLVGIINREPHTSNKIMRQLYVSAINDATDSIRIINPYFTLVPSITKALSNALKRGVKIDLMVSAKSDIPLTPDCVLYQAHKLMKRGANVWVYQPGFHHSKIMMVDGCFCTIGSANLDARSLRFDYEENAVVIDPHTTKELNDMFNNDIKESILMTPEYWNEMRTPWQKFRGWFGHLLTPVL